MAHIRVGTRGSDLALTQCTQLVNLMREREPEHTFELKIIKTMGDLDRTQPLHAFGTQGVFVKELEVALAAGEIECAVHSLKDVPHQLPEGMEIGVYTERENPFDVLISKGETLAEFKPGARIGTGSVRRRIMLQQIRPDLEYVEIRGNIETRINEVLEGDLDGVILAAAGLKRVGRLEVATQQFSVTEMIPSIGQGVLGIEVRSNDTSTQKIVGSVDHRESRIAMEIERSFMEKIGGGCKAPMAAFATVIDESVAVEAMIANQQNGEIVRFSKTYQEPVSEDIVSEMVTWFTEECALRGVPLPSELDDHALLS
ncbi:MAG: hydroxymethylbilane synthase [Fibrobacterales bacterium]